MLVRLKATLARRPLASFLVLCGAAWSIFVGAAIAGSDSWINDASWVSRVATGLLALASCWAVSGPPDERPRRPTQVFIAVAVALLVMGAGVLRVWAEWHTVYASALAGSSSVHLSFPSLGSWIGDYLHDKLAWLGALMAGLVLAGALSPYPVIRRTARSLVDWRSTRIWRVVGVALIVVAACAGATVIGAGFVRSGGPADTVVSYSPLYTAVGFLSSLLSGTVVVFAWYGFAGARLGRRLPPLAVGLLIGAAIDLPGILAISAYLALSGQGFGWNRSLDLAIGSGLALGVLGVWLARCARGSLLPTLVLYAAFAAGSDIATRTTSMARYDWAQQYYPVFAMIAAAAFVLAGRMWRRPDAAATPPAPGAPAPPPGHYHVTVRDVSMPL